MCHFYHMLRLHDAIKFCLTYNAALMAKYVFICVNASQAIVNLLNLDETKKQKKKKRNREEVTKKGFLPNTKWKYRTEK